MNKRRYIILLSSILFLAILWTSRYLHVNRYYDDLTITKTEIYAMGEEIPFENNLIDKEHSAIGYSIRVDDVQVWNQSVVFQEDKQNKLPNKVICVTVTIRCDRDNSMPINIGLFNLFSENMNFGLDSDDLRHLNSHLKNAPELQLQNGEECQVILPYRVYQKDLSKTDWTNLEESTFYFQICMFPRRIYFKLST